MHIPDGFVAPQVYVPAYLIDGLFLVYSFGKFRKALKEKTIPYIASLSLLSFVLMSVAVPLPGGTSVHSLGVASLSLLFGPWVAFLCVSLLLFLQAVVFGEGGITTFPINSIGMGLLGSFCAFYTYRVMRAFFSDKISLFLAGFLSTLFSALLIAVILGLHPHLFKDASGKPLYFPFGFSVVIPALLLPHIIVGVGEGILTYLVVEFLKGRVGYEG
ncbi:cobalamin (vitamin B12) biosynthesis CbiM protein [Hydrogenobacter thermophilus TK-6]|uniref:Cobalamin biosynthesis protein, ABC-type cobalt transport system permease component n=1 Tax=Hydrogenobacter thermophilus (strain DSM 6534 / IAM 12695 / TK-6) TaxID=608538 RepID=D3DGH4_HYDTT|nr:energy-coupling factor ABC transporter permease [Hydrogenobacter thermophilus]ADO44861.1 cobalamin (vitamin B12) biosynthesis CbiM protein [Hydrogenobacter thermophilus TK-6]BAI68926.1 cobalamin biosynthesis protein, ABC-type cobalt transport system permease component [Hydrogenobacter thermophilus TK-6]